MIENMLLESCYRLWLEEGFYSYGLSDLLFKEGMFLSLRRELAYCMKLDLYFQRYTIYKFAKDLTLHI